MNAEEAAEAARRVKAKYVFPCHYGTIVGTKANAEKLKQLLPDKEVIIQ
jgi:L-ascorbate metabolism protein UlaG (beta-lactamase superfamily)